MTGVGKEPGLSWLPPTAGDGIAHLIMETQMVVYKTTTYDWSTLPDPERVQGTMAALKNNGIDSYFAQTSEEARARLFELLPQSVEVLNNSSVTLEQIGAASEILSSGRFTAVRNKLKTLDHEKNRREMRQLGAAPDWAVGSVHAVTEKGQCVIASMTGSQLPGYTYGAAHVVWVVGMQKIVVDLDAAMRRIYEYTLLLEDEHAMKKYGVHSSVNKVLVVNREVYPERIKIIFVNEVLGF
jgi:hypothetical protein